MSTRHIERCPNRCGRFAPKPERCGSIVVGFSVDFSKSQPLFASKLCSTCKRIDDRRNKRRAVLARNLRKAFGD